MRFVEPVSPRAATGLARQTYAQVTRDFGLVRDLAGNSPFLAHSPNPELLAGFWSVLYETLIVEGKLSRTDKEAIAATVSSINSCPFCVDVHALLSGVAGSGRVDRKALARGEPVGLGDRHRREIVEWARATRDPDSQIVRTPPFGAEGAPEAVGTAVAFHYVNRIVDVFQGPEGLSVGPGPLGRLMAPLVGRFAGRAMRRRHEPARTLSLLPEAERPPDLAWAGAAARIAAAFACFAAAAERAGASALPDAVRTRIADSVARWRGDDPGLGGEWIEAALGDLDAESRALARLPLLAALAPYRVTGSDVEEFRLRLPGDPALVAAVAWSALTAARRIGSWLTPESQPASA